MPRIVGPIGRGELQYAELWKAAQRLTTRPVKFGTVTPELIAFAVQDSHYDDVRARIMAISDALNEELHDLADAGCPVIQIEEPQIHLAAVRGIVDEVITLDFLIDVFNNTVKGLRDKTEVWCHTCWGNPSQQRMFAEVQSYEASLEYPEPCRCGRDHLRDVQLRPRRSRPRSDGEITGKRIGIGVIDHHTLQVESPQEVAELLRLALEHIPVEQLVVCTDCGMGREGMSRRHAFYKMVSMVLGHEPRPRRARAAGGRVPRRRPALLADQDELT